MRPIAVSLLLATACVRKEDVFEVTLPAEGVEDVFCDIDAGNFTYSGTGVTEEFLLSVHSWGVGSSQGRAEARIANNVWGAQVADGFLDLWGRSHVRRSGVDFSVRGPERVNVEAVLLDGTAELYDVDGTHLVTANQVVGSGIHGDADFYAALSGINVEVFPRDDSTLRFEAFGDVYVALPYGRDYDLQVFADPDWGVEVTDLGFDELVLAPDFVSARSGDGSIEVEVYVAGGTFYLWEAIEVPTVLARSSSVPPGGGSE